MKQRILWLCAVLLFLPGLAQAKIFLADTDDTLQVVTASGVSTIHMYASWADITTSALTPGSSSSRVTTATTTTLVASPGASTQRQIKGFSVRNNHASSSNAITVQFFDGTNATELIKYTLLAGETLQWGEDENFRIIDASGQVKSTVALQTGSSTIGALTANQSVNQTQIAGNSVSTGVGASGTGTQRVASLLHDGTNTAVVATSTPGTSDAGLVVRPINPNLAADNSTNSTSKVPVLVGVATTAAPTYTTTNQVPLSLTTAGGLRVDGSATTQPVSGTVTANAGTGNFTVAQATGTNLHMVCDSGCSSSSGFADNGAFTFGTTAINPIGGVFDDTSPNTATENSAAIARITQNKALHMNLRNASGTEIGTSGNPIRTDPTGTTTQPVNVAQMNGVTITMGNGASGTGVQRVTLASDSTGQVALAAGSNTVGNVGVLPVTSGGTSVCYLTSAATTNATNCKASAGQLYGFDLINTTTTIYYLRVYNLSSAPTCSSATGFVRTIPVPPAGAAGQAGGITRSIPVGEAYGTGLGFCLTGGGSSTDNTNAATGVYVSLNYK